MSIINIRWLLICLITLSSPYAKAGLLGPSDYEECILDRMKGIRSDVAARAVIAACSDKFREKSHQPTADETLLEFNKSRVLSATQVQNIKKEEVSWTKDGSGLMVKLYNGNSDIAITRVIYRYRINEGKWSNKQIWNFQKSNFDSFFLPYSYRQLFLENLETKKLPKNFNVSIEILEASRP